MGYNLFAKLADTPKYWVFGVVVWFGVWIWPLSAFPPNRVVWLCGLV